MEAMVYILELLYRGSRFSNILMLYKLNRVKNAVQFVLPAFFSDSVCVCLCYWRKSLAPRRHFAIRDATDDKESNRRLEFENKKIVGVW